MECRLAGETEVLGEKLPQRHFCPSQNPTWPDPGLNPGRRGGKPVTNHLSYGAALTIALSYNSTAHNRWLSQARYICFLGYKFLQFHYDRLTNSCSWPIHSFTNWFTLSLTPLIQFSYKSSSLSLVWSQFTV
jgi:hypothetical protein